MATQLYYKKKSMETMSVCKDDTTVVKTHDVNEVHPTTTTAQIIHPTKENV